MPEITPLSIKQKTECKYLENSFKAKYNSSTDINPEEGSFEMTIRVLQWRVNCKLYSRQYNDSNYKVIEVLARDHVKEELSDFIISPNQPKCLSLEYGI